MSFFASIDLAVPAYPSLLGISVFALFLLLLLVALVCLSLCVCLGCEVSKRSACVYGKRCPSLQAGAMWGARRKDSARKLRITRRLTPTKNEKRSRSPPAYLLRLPPLSCRSALTRAHCSAKSPPGPPRGFPGVAKGVAEKAREAIMSTFLENSRSNCHRQRNQRSRQRTIDQQRNHSTARYFQFLIVTLYLMMCWRSALVGGRKGLCKARDAWGKLIQINTAEFCCPAGSRRSSRGRQLQRRNPGGWSWQQCGVVNFE